MSVLVVLCVLAAGVRDPGPPGLRRPRRRTTQSRPVGADARGARPPWRSTRCPTTLNDHTVAGDTAAGRMVGSAIWAQVFRVGPGLTPQLDTNVVDSAEVVSLSPQTVVYKIDPRAVWSDGVPISADGLHLRLAVATRGRAPTSTARPTRWRPPWGTATLPVAHGLQRRADRDRRVPHAVRRLGLAVRRPAAGARGRAGGVEPRVRPVRHRGLRLGRALGGAVVAARFGDRRWAATRGGGGARPPSTGSW